MKIVVTGGAGFLGSAVCRHFLEQPVTTIVNVDKLTYAANLASLLVPRQPAVVATLAPGRRSRQPLKPRSGCGGVRVLER